MPDLLHTFASIFRDDKITPNLIQFTEAALQELETSLFDKHCKVS